MTTQQADILVGWKEVAGYLRVSVRTAKRWHASDPMPFLVWSRRMTTTPALLEWVNRRLKEVG